MRIAMMIATAILVAGCGVGGGGPVLMEVRPEGAAAPVVSESVPAASRAAATAMPEF
jgi:hypothetical protein